MLLQPRPSLTAVDEGKRPCLAGTGPGIKLLSSPSDPTELRQRAMPGSGSVSRWDLGNVATLDGSNATSLLKCCQGGATDLFLVGELFGDLKERAGLSFVLVNERGEAQHVQRGFVRTRCGG